MWSDPIGKFEKIAGERIKLLNLSLVTTYYAAVVAFCAQKNMGLSGYL